MNTCELFLVLPAQTTSIQHYAHLTEYMIFTLSLAAFVVYDYFILDLDLQILLVEKSRSLEVNM